MPFIPAYADTVTMGVNMNMNMNMATFQIPTIDIAPYLEDASTDAAIQVVRDVRSACETCGFFSLVGHGIPRSIQDNLFRATKKLFNLPPAEKHALRHPHLKNRGYEVIGSQALQEDALPDLKEVRVLPHQAVHVSPAE